MAAMRAVPKTIDRDLYINMLECSIDLLLDYMEIHLEEDIIDILDSAYQGLKIIGIHNNKDLSSLVFEVIESTLNSYLEDLVETEGFVYEAFLRMKMSLILWMIIIKQIVNYGYFSI